MSGVKYSYETGIMKTFHTADYAVFACTLLMSAAIGLFYAIKDRKKNTTDDYLLAGRGMHPFPVAMSLLSSFISAITILGTPAEVYVHSTMYWWISVAFIITAMGAAHIFIPIFYNLGITSVFEVSCFICTLSSPHRQQSKTHLTIGESGSKIVRNNVFDCHLSPVFTALATRTWNYNASLEVRKT